MGDVDDDMLMARVQARDQAAFDCLVSRHVDSLHRYLSRLLRSEADADELTQEAFLRLWQRAGSYRAGRVRLTTWLHRIAHNLAVDRLRRHRPTHAAAAAEGAEPIDPAADPQQLLAADQRRRRLDRALAALPARQRAALVLCQVQELSNREAAEVLGLSVRGVESLLARARRTLRAALRGPAEHEP